MSRCIPSCECLASTCSSRVAWSYVSGRERVLACMLEAGAPSTTLTLVSMSFDMPGKVFLLLSMVYWPIVLLFHHHIFPHTIENTNEIFVILTCFMALWLCGECLALRFLIRRAVGSRVCGRFVEYWELREVRRDRKFRSKEMMLLLCLLKGLVIALLFLRDFSFHIVVMACAFGIAAAISGNYREVLKFIEVMSQRPGEDLLEALHSLQDADSQADFSWQDALQSYRHMEHGLCDLFEKLSPCYALWLGNRYLLVVALSAILKAAFSKRAEWIQAAAAVLGMCLAVRTAAETLLKLRKISSLFSGSINYVAGYKKLPTLFSAASQVVGRSGLSDQMSIEIDRFLRYLERSTAGAQIFGQRIDGAMVAKLFATVSFFSYGVTWVAQEVFADDG